MSRPQWKLTVRHGSEVEHAGFDDLDEAVAAMRERALEIRAEGPVEAGLAAARLRARRTRSRPACS